MLDNNIKYSTEVQGGNPSKIIGNSMGFSMWSYTLYTPLPNPKRKTPCIRPGGSALGLVFLKKLLLFLVGMTCIKLKHYKLTLYNKLILISVLMCVQFSKLIAFTWITGPKKGVHHNNVLKVHNSTIGSFCLTSGKSLFTGSNGALGFGRFSWINATFGGSGVNGTLLGLFESRKLLHVKPIG